MGIDVQRTAYNTQLDAYESSVVWVHAQLYPYTVRVWAPECSRTDVLEVGCGTGYFLRELIRLGILFRSYTGVDVSEEAISRAQRCYPNVQWLIDDAHMLASVPDHSYDVAVSYGCLHHLERPEVALKSIARKLRPGGRFFAVELNRPHSAESFVGFYACLLGFRVSYRPRTRKPSYAHPGHPGKRMPSEYRLALEDAGFTRVSVRSLALNLLPGAVMRIPPVFRLVVLASGPLLRLDKFEGVGSIVLISGQR